METSITFSVKKYRPSFFAISGFPSSMNIVPVAYIPTSDNTTILNTGYGLVFTMVYRPTRARIESIPLQDLKIKTLPYQS